MLFTRPGMSEHDRYRAVHAHHRGARLALGDAPVTQAMLPNLPQVTPGSVNTDAAVKVMKDRVIEAAVSVALAQTATSVAVDTATLAAAQAAGYATVAAAMAAGSVVPIIGWAAAVLIAIGTFIGNESAKRQIKWVIADATKKIKDYGAQTMAQIQARQMQIGNEEFPAAQALAASGQALDGLDGFKDWITHTVASLQVKSVKAVGDAILKTGAVGAKLVGDKRGEALANKKKAIWDANSARVEALFEGKLQNPYRMIAQDLDTVGRTLSGQQSVHVVNQKVRDLIAASHRDMDAYKAATMAAMETADYRSAVRTNIAKALRGDPAFQAQVSELDARAKMVDNTMNSVQHTASSGSAGGLLASAAGLLGAFLFLKP